MRIDAVAAGCFSAKMICPRMGAQGDGPGASQPRTGTVSVQVARAREGEFELLAKAPTPREKTPLGWRPCCSVAFSPFYPCSAIGSFPNLDVKLAVGQKRIRHLRRISVDLKSMQAQAG